MSSGYYVRHTPFQLSTHLNSVNPSSQINAKDHWLSHPNGVEQGDTIRFSRQTQLENIPPSSPHYFQREQQAATLHQRHDQEPNERTISICRTGTPLPPTRSERSYGYGFLSLSPAPQTLVRPSFQANALLDGHRNAAMPLNGFAAGDTRQVPTNVYGAPGHAASGPVIHTAHPHPYPQHSQPSQPFAAPQVHPGPQSYTVHTSSSVPLGGMNQPNTGSFSSTSQAPAALHNQHDRNLSAVHPDQRQVVAQSRAYGNFADFVVKQSPRLDHRPQQHPNIQPQQAIPHNDPAHPHGSNPHPRGNQRGGSGFIRQADRPAGKCGGSEVPRAFIPAPDSRFSNPDMESMWNAGTARPVVGGENWFNGGVHCEVGRPNYMAMANQVQRPLPPQSTWKGVDTSAGAMIYSSSSASSPVVQQSGAITPEEEAAFHSTYHVYRNSLLPSNGGSALGHLVPPDQGAVLPPPPGLERQFGLQRAGSMHSISSTSLGGTNGVEPSPASGLGAGRETPKPKPGWWSLAGLMEGMKVAPSKTSPLESLRATSPLAPPGLENQYGLHRAGTPSFGQVSNEQQKQQHQDAPNAPPHLPPSRLPYLSVNSTFPRSTPVSTGSATESPFSASGSGVLRSAKGKTRAEGAGVPGYYQMYQTPTRARIVSRSATSPPGDSPVPTISFQGPTPRKRRLVPSKASGNGDPNTLVVAEKGQKWFWEDLDDDGGGAFCEDVDMEVPASPSPVGTSNGASSLQQRPESPISGSDTVQIDFLQDGSMWTTMGSPASIWYSGALRLSNPDDEPLKDYELKNIVCVIQWGTLPFSSIHLGSLSMGRPVTRRKLACQIAKQCLDYFGRHATNPSVPDVDCLRLDGVLFTAGRVLRPILRAMSGRVAYSSTLTMSEFQALLTNNPWAESTV